MVCFPSSNSVHTQIVSNVETICFLCVAQQSHKRPRLPSGKDSAHQICDTLLRFVWNSSILCALPYASFDMQASSPNTSHTGEYMNCPTSCQLCTVRHLTHHSLPLQYAGSDCLTPAGTIAVDMRDGVVPAQKTIDLQALFKNSQLVTHNEGKPQTESLASSTFQSRCRAFTVITGHSIPVRGDWPTLMREFILQACSQSTPSC
jgi:hypothetical protein